MVEDSAVIGMSDALLNFHVGTRLFGHEMDVSGSGCQERAVRVFRERDEFGNKGRRIEDAVRWASGEETWMVVERARDIGFRVSMTDVSPGVGQVVIVEDRLKHPKHDRVEVTMYYGVTKTADSCSRALCRAIVLALMSQEDRCP